MNRGKCQEWVRTPGRVAGRWLVVVLSVLALGPAGFAAVTPTINKINNLDAGAVIPGASSGTLVLDSNAYPGGRRSSTGGTLLGGSPSFTLGALTLTGKPGNPWTITGNGSFGPLTGPGGKTIAVASIDFEPSSSNSGTFPAAATSTSTTSTFYLGAVLNIPATGTLASGTYTGPAYIVLTDTVSNLSSTMSFTITLKVDPTPIAMTKLSDLAFGDIFTGATSGTVKLSPAGARTLTGGVLPGTLSAFQAASFTVTGANNATYAITLPSSANLTCGAASMTVTGLTSSPSGLGALSSTGQQKLSVGGQLNVGANQADGDYKGTFSVTVAYN